MTHTTRQEAIRSIVNRPAIESQVPYKLVSTSEIFGENVFSLGVMRDRLPKPIFKQLKATVETGARLNPDVAEVVAAAMKEWALDKGATHYAHVFYPLTGQTAEKHDSFFIPVGEGNTIAEFGGNALIQGEPDGSSFPSGGIRQTFEARGYTIWDVTSPAYIIENPNGATLCIPTAFVSWTGEALDKKTPVLRSMQALNVHAQRVLKLFGKDGAFVSSTAGPEQEYFLIDRNFLALRPDLLNAGRSLFGAVPPKGQEFEDQYFGVIPERVLACMCEVERECYKLGIPVKTRHNEVAPSQYELAPIYEFANVATDHQQLIMTTLRRVAEKYGLACLLHEKPFTGINGSGKHLNYSLGSAIAGNLFDPGDTPSENAQFLVFCAAMIRATYKWGGLFRAVVASASNDHRLGANEAPPAIISVFLGDELTEIFEAIAKGKAPKSVRGDLHVGVDVLPPIPRHAGDRNRTSPMAFTGNRFEFRAVGACQSIAGPLVALNTALTESLDYCATALEKEDTSTPAKLGKAVEKLVKSIWNECSKVVFNGDGYSAAWHKEAEKRGLLNLRTTPDSLPQLVQPETIKLFGAYKVLSDRELHSRYDVYCEHYIKTITMEARLTVEIAGTQILPAAMRYQTELANNAVALKGAGLKPDTSALKTVSGLIAELQAAIAALKTACDKKVSDHQAKCEWCRDGIMPAMLKVRAAADSLETVVADDYWPLPTYQEMLFVK